MAHGRAMTVLRRPAPREVVDALGSRETAGELIRAGVVTLFREQRVDGEKRKVEWVERWGTHGLVAKFAGGNVTDVDRRAVHYAAGAAYEAWFEEGDALWNEHEEWIFHWHAVGEGDRAWPIVERYALWLHNGAQLRSALQMLDGCEAAGTTGARLSAALLFAARTRTILGDQSRGVENSLLRALDLAESDECRGNVLLEHGVLLLVQGKYEDAEVLLRRSFDISEALGVERPYYGASSFNLGRVLHEQGKYGEAEVLLRNAIAIQQKEYGVECSYYAASLHELGRLLLKQDMYGEAEVLLRMSRAINEKTYGVDHPTYGNSLNELALVLKAQEKFSEAEVALRQAVAIAERSLDPLHPAVGRRLMNLGIVLAEQGREDEGEPLLRRGLGILRAVHGSEHSDVAQSLNLLAQVQARMGNPEARATACQAIEALSKSLGFDHPVTRRLAPVLEQIVAGAAATGPLGALLERRLREGAAALEAGDARHAADSAHLGRRPRP